MAALKRGGGHAYAQGTRFMCCSRRVLSVMLFQALENAKAASIISQFTVKTLH